jgi:hypothetical protein
MFEGVYNKMESIDLNPELEKKEIEVEGEGATGREISNFIKGHMHTLMKKDKEFFKDATLDDVVKRSKPSFFEEK